jgi:TolB-like protein/Flp pilus assembly protein TadD
VHFRFADFEIDLGQQELRRSGEAVRVEPQVFDLLVHLVRNRDRIVSKDELIDTIWQGRIVSEAALSSRINAARRALGDSGNEQNFIRTLHKRGFRFVAELDDPGDTPPPASGEPVPEAAHTAPPIAPDASPINVPAQMTRPAIAVLPFDNLSGDAENDYFSYGMTEDIIRLLARNRWLTVISRHSTIAFAGPAVDVRQVAEALGVRYVLVGSVRKNRDAVRITAELVAADGTQLWADSYDLTLEDIFGIQEEMARQIAATIEPELSRVEQQLAARKAPDSLDAWDCYQRALWHLWAFTTPGFDKAEEFFRRAIEIDPDFARAHGALGYVNVQRALYDEPEVRAKRLETALQQARDSVALDERDCFCHCVLGRTLCLLRNNDEATASLDLSIELNPSFAQGFFAQGFNMLWSGREIEAETLLDRATLLSPRDSHVWSFHHVRSWAHFSLGEYEMAAEFARRATRQRNVTYRAFATLAASLGKLGGGEDAEAAARELAVRKPGYTTGTPRQEFFFCNDDSFVDRFVAGLRAAKVPER